MKTVGLVALGAVLGIVGAGFSLGWYILRKASES